MAFKLNSLYMVIGIVILVFYLFIISMTYFFQEKFLFHPVPLPSSVSLGTHYFNGKEVEIETKDKVKISALFFRTNSDRAILYLHGNAGNLESWQDVYQDVGHVGYNVLIIDYRGYGKSSGTISEKGLYLDGEAAFDFLLQKGFSPENIVVFGRSMGTGVATELAIQHKNIKALLLETPFTSLKAVAQSTAPYLLPVLWLKYDFNNLEKMDRIEAPLLVIHGTSDQLIPFSHGIKVYERYAKDKQFLEIESGEHNNLGTFPAYRKGLTDFFIKMDREKERH